MCDGPRAVRAHAPLSQKAQDWFLASALGKSPRPTGLVLEYYEARCAHGRPAVTALSLADALVLLACSANAPTNAFCCEISFEISLHHSRVCCCAREMCADTTLHCKRQANGRRGDSRRPAALTPRAASRSARCSRRTRALGGRPGSRTCCTQGPARAVGSLDPSPSLRARGRACVTNTALTMDSSCDRNATGTSSGAAAGAFTAASGTEQVRLPR
jgi:hypothetical protein